MAMRKRNFGQEPKAFFAPETGGVFSSADEWGKERERTPINIRNCLFAGLLLFRPVILFLPQFFFFSVSSRPT